MVGVKLIRTEAFRVLDVETIKVYSYLHKYPRAGELVQWMGVMLSFIGQDLGVWRRNESSRDPDIPLVGFRNNVPIFSVAFCLRSRC